MQLAHGIQHRRAVLSEGSSPSNCQLLESALSELQDALATYSVAESAREPQSTQEAVVDVVQKETSPVVVDPSKWPVRGGGSGLYHRMSGKGTRTAVEPPKYWPPIGGSSGPHRMAGRYPPKRVLPAAAAAAAVATSRLRVTGRKRAALRRLLRVLRGKPAWKAIGGSSGPHRMAGRR